MPDLSGRAALVTGGGSGIGRAAAAALVDAGASVLICGVDGDQIARTAAELGGDRVAGRRVDVTRETEVADAVAEAVGAFGGLDVLVTAAGIQRYGTAAETSSQLWDEVMAVNLKGTFLAIKHALPALRQRRGSIVVVSSVQAYATQTRVAAYSTSKGALNALVRSVALDEAANGVRANAVCPGSVDTPMLRDAARQFSDGTDQGEQRLVDSWGTMHPLGRVATPAEVGAVIAFLASEEASFVTGLGVPVDGGLLAGLPVLLP